MRIGFAKGQCFQFGVKELWRDGKGRGLSELVGWVRHLSQCLREFVPERRGIHASMYAWFCFNGLAINPDQSEAILFGSWQRLRDFPLLASIDLAGTAVPLSDTVKTVLGQNGTDKMVWTKWYTDKMSLDKMVWTKWYGKNGTNFYFLYTLIQLNSMC